VEPLEFTAVVKPSSTPSVMQVYMTSAMDQPLPVEDVSDDLVFVLHQEAGTEVDQQTMHYMLCDACQAFAESLLAMLCGPSKAFYDLHA